MQIDNRKDILLLLLYAPGTSGAFNDPVVGRTRLVKAVFLFQKEIWKKFKSNITLKEENLYEFFPWSYGPFSAQVYDDLTFFSLRGFLEVNLIKDDILVESVEEWNLWIKTYSNDSDVTEYHEEEFKLTFPKGIEFTANLFASLSENQKEIIREFKLRITTTPLKALLRYVYREYPEQTDKSLIKENVTRY